MNDYTEQTKIELRQANRILSFDKRFWLRREMLKINPKNSLETALNMIQSENYAYLYGIKSSVREKNLRVAGSLLRSLLESTANAHWLIRDKTGKRAGKYVDSVQDFTDYVNETGNKNTFTIDNLPREASTWTTSSAEDRINSFSPQAKVVWDYCSIFTHASPSYLALNEGADKVLNYVVSQANTYALTARYLIKSSTDVYDKREKKFLDTMANELLRKHGIA